MNFALMRTMRTNHEGRNAEIRDHNRSHVAQSPLARKLPRDIHNLGKDLFGAEGLEKVLAHTGAPRKISCYFDDLDGPNLEVHFDVVYDINAIWDDLVKDTCSDQYNVVDKLHQKRGLMVDVGANIGTEAILTMKAHPDFRVVALEPVPTAYFYLRWNMRLNGIRHLSESDISDPKKPSGILALNKAATADGKDVMVHWPGDAGTELASTGEFWPWSPNTGNERNVQSVNLVNFLKYNNVGPVELLKMDCEGCEYEVIPTMGNFLCEGNNVQRIEAEMHGDPNTHPDNEVLISKGLVKRTTRVLERCGCSNFDSWLSCDAADAWDKQL